LKLIYYLLVYYGYTVKRCASRDMWLGWACISLDASTVLSAVTINEEISDHLYYFTVHYDHYVAAACLTAYRYGCVLLLGVATCRC